LKNENYKKKLSIFILLTIFLILLFYYNSSHKKIDAPQKEISFPIKTNEKKYLQRLWALKK